MRIEPRILAVIASASVCFFSAPAHAALDDAAAQALAKKGGCAGCHKLDKNGMGPSYKAIAAKRKGQADAVEAMTKAVRGGSTGTYGKKSMDPIPGDTISDTDLVSFLQCVLAQQ